MFRFIRNLFSPVLSDTTIKKYIDKGLLITTPINDIQFQPNSVDLTLDSKVKILQHSYYHNYQKYQNRIIDRIDNYIDIRFPIKYIDKDFADGKTASGENLKCYVLQPHEFVLMSSKEILNIPNGIIAFVQGRSSIARLGIQIEQAGLIDSGFEGNITLEIFNESDERIMLFEGMRIAQVYFYKSQYSKYLYGENKNKYYKQLGPTESRIFKDFNMEEN